MTSGLERAVVGALFALAFAAPAIWGVWQL